MLDLLSQLMVCSKDSVPRADTGPPSQLNILGVLDLCRKKKGPLPMSRPGRKEMARKCVVGR